MSNGEKFKGWYKPVEQKALSKYQRDDLFGMLNNLRSGSVEYLIESIRQVASENNLSPWEVTRQLRDDLSEKKNIRNYQESIYYLGDVHGGDQKLIDSLYSLSVKRPDYLIFLGDLTGSEEMEEFKRRFYNSVTNRSKPLLEKNPDVSDEDLLTFPSQEEDKTLKQGYIGLLQYQLMLEGKSQEEIQTILCGLPDRQLADGIRDLSKQRYYGDWVATLPWAVRKGVLNSLEQNAQKLLDPIDTLKSLGTKVVMIAGNWDDQRGGAATMAGKDLKAFDVKKFFREKGVDFYDQLAALETKITLQILLPFYALRDFNLVPLLDIHKVGRMCGNARSNNKSVILVAHGEPNIRFHDVVKTAEREQIIENFGKAVYEFEPDEIIYGHQHNPLTDNGEKVDPSLKYVLRLKGDQLNLVESDDEIGQDPADCIISFVPLRQFASLDVLIKDRQRLPFKLGGRRQPARLQND